MTRRSARTAFASVRGRILGLVLVPLLCLVVVAGQQVTARHDGVDTANRSRAIVDAYLEVGRLRAGIQLEYAATTGMTQTSAAGFSPAAPSTVALIGFDTAGTAIAYAARNDTCVAELETLLPALGIATVAELRALLGSRAGLAEDVAVNGMLADPAALIERVDGTYRAIDGGLDRIQQALRRELLDAAVGQGDAWDRLRAELAVADDIVVWVDAVATETRLLTVASTIGAARAEDVYELGAARMAELGSRDRLRASALASLVDLDRPEQQRWEAARKAAADAAGISRPGVADDAAFPAGSSRLRVQDPDAGGDALASVAVAVAVAVDGIVLADDALDSLDVVSERADATVEELVGAAVRDELLSLVLLGAAIATSFAVAVMTTRGLTRPLAGLTRQANAIRDGEFASTPRPGRLPDEVAVVGAALDELAANLSLLTQQAAALGAGRLKDPLLDRSVPGKLGESLRSSVGRLSELTDRLARQARRDPMTGLANRSAVVERLEDALQRAQRSGRPFGLLYVDLDEFKSVNDAFGHEQGDALLRVVAQRLEHFATGDRMAGRLGADEFVVVVEDGDVASLLVSLGEGLLDAVQQPVELEGSTYRLSLSVGVALSRPGQDASGLLRDAGQATVDAKRHGKGRVQAFDPAMQEGLERRARVQHDLRRAIAEDEFELHLQPVIETASGRVEGAEGLIRWRLADGTVVPPNDFIPIAEESALIIDIGRLVIDKACRQLAEWSLAGRADLHVAINVGGRHVTDGTLAEDIRRGLAAHGVRAEHLVVELTESNLVSDLEVAAAVLEELRSLGVRIALDDFGTGYSSLSYLRRLPIDTMKLDRSYVNGLGSDEQETSIVRSLVQLADSLALDVVAEGVETEEQLDHLRRLGCRSVQGYLLARPMPPEQFHEWLGRRPVAEDDAVRNAA